MRFVGKVWRFLVGVKDGLVLLLMILFFGSLYVALSAAPTIGAGEHGALLLDLDGPIVEEPATASPFEIVSGVALPREYRLRDVVNALRTAATDDRVEAVVLDLDIFSGGGQVALSDVAAAMDVVRRAKKPVLAFASGYTDDSYQLAAHASEIWLDPLGAVAITGPGGASLYFKGLLDKLGVTANVYKVGTYKAATEPFTRNDMSPEARESIQAIATALWDNWRNEVQRARPKAKLAAYIADPAALIARSGGDMAKGALAAGLVDRLGDRTAFGRRVAEIVGSDDDDVPGSFRTLGLGAWTREKPAGDLDGEIGVLTVAGEIVDGDSEAGTAGAETIAKLLAKGVDEKNLKALVVRVDSPGGSVFASERIRRAILDAKASGLPVVVSMGSVAASGGYWIATAGDQVLAEPSTITGSIGVFGIIPSFQGTLTKLGLGADGVKTTPLSGEPDLLRGPSPEAGRLIQMSVEQIYRRFLTLVAASRKLPVQRIDEIGQGRVWDGGTAHQLGLVDRFGSLDQAIAEAARRARLDPATAKPVFLDREPSLFASLFGSVDEEEEDQQARDVFSRVAARSSLTLARAVTDAERLVAGPALQARCLQCPPSASRRIGAAKRDRLQAMLGLLMP
ncbi:signal peptide peptidase SppA [Sphingomonas sp.]|uniref:signal peptide peptidase SppA n=1 Tax=Sphingomonas sp. TaxID=28214 RepID=UPI002FC989BC